MLHLGASRLHLLAEDSALAKEKSLLPNDNDNRVRVLGLTAPGLFFHKLEAFMKSKLEAKKDLVNHPLLRYAVVATHGTDEPGSHEY